MITSSFEEPAKLLDVASGQVFFLSGTTMLGRGKDNDIVLRGDLSVSRAHAKIYIEGGRYYFEDLLSCNGSLLNGLVMQGRAVLWPNDRIHLGRSEFVFLSQKPMPEHAVKESDSMPVKKTFGSVLKGICSRAALQF